MPDSQKFGHPFIPNSAPKARERALKEIGIKDVEEIYATIPPELRFKGKLDLPKPFLTEAALRRHVEGMISKNKSAHEYLNFLGAGTWQHYVPAVCDEIANRGEFLTAYGGGPYGDPGKLQALFESQSMLGELLGMEAVAAPTYDWSAAVASAMLMACRLTGRKEVLVPENMSGERHAQIWNFVRPHMAVTKVKMDPATGRLDVKDLKAKLSDKVAGVYFENPTYLGTIETEADAIVAAAHEKGALAIAGVDPITLGVLAPPSAYGADVAVGDYQTLGIHMYGGGGLGGFMACADDPKLVHGLSTYLISVGDGEKKGEHVFGYTEFHRTHYETRGVAVDYTGTTQWLWGIIGGVYLALLGPHGIRELGEGVMQKSRYAATVLGDIDGVRSPRLEAPFFKEFVVNFDGRKKSVAQVNKALLERKVFGGLDLSKEFPSLGQSALYCVTEVHTKDDIDTLVSALKEVLK